MPRPRRKYTNQNQDPLKKDESINCTLIDINSKTMDINQTKLVMWKSEVKDKMNEAYKKLNNMHKENLAVFELNFQTSVMATPFKILNKVIDMNSENFRSIFLCDKPETECYQDLQSPVSSEPVTTAVRRRSRSASSIKYSTRSSNQRLYSTRSSSVTSVDMYKTPKSTLRLSTILSKKKYTVTKPKKAENSGVHVKRVMKPDEEAISTCGSPLYVASCSVGAPHVNIPLPGGVVLNIEPKTPKGPIEVLGLDPKTKNQIKILCEQLKKLF